MGFMIKNTDSIAKIGGDMNGDGFDDIIVGSASKKATRGVVYVIHSGMIFF